MDIDEVTRPNRADEVVRLFDRYGEDLLRVAYLLTSDRSLAEELVQETFTRAWRSWGQLRNPDAARAWLRATLVNLARRSLRRRLRDWQARVARQGADAEADIAVPEPDHALRIDLDRAIAKLPLRRRACVVLRYYADLSEQDTAAVLGVSVGTVKSSTHRALRQLEQILGAPAPAATARER
jgi:RNA polymerase sigma-70 factor (sigma-E family)